MAGELFELEVQEQGQNVLMYDSKPVKKFAITVAGADHNTAKRINLVEADNKEHMLKRIEDMKARLNEIAKDPRLTE